MQLLKIVFVSISCLHCVCCAVIMLTCMVAFNKSTHWEQSSSLLAKKKKVRSGKTSLENHNNDSNITDNKNNTDDAQNWGNHPVLYNSTGSLGHFCQK